MRLKNFFFLVRDVYNRMSVLYHQNASAPSVNWLGGVELCHADFPGSGALCAKYVMNWEMPA